VSGYEGGINFIYTQTQVRVVAAPDRHHSIVCLGFEKAAPNAMEEAAKEEAKLAILVGNIDSDGTPLVIVMYRCRAFFFMSYSRWMTMD
jgi:hypothetical protein